MQQHNSNEPWITGWRQTNWPLNGGTYWKNKDQTMNYFNDVMKLYMAHYTAALGFADVLASIEAEKIPDRNAASRLVEFSDRMFAQGVVDEENGPVLGKIDVDVYDIEKTCVTISSFVEAQGYGELLNLD